MKLTSGGVVKKKKAINRGKTKLMIDSSDAPPSLSIEERVKLRRTKAIQPSPSNVVPKKSTKIQKSQPSKPVENRRSRTKTSTKKPTSKSFLGSGLDLDNIVLGNRQRRCVQT